MWSIVSITMKDRRKEEWQQCGDKVVASFSDKIRLKKIIRDNFRSIASVKVAATAAYLDLRTRRQLGHMTQSELESESIFSGRSRSRLKFVDSAALVWWQVECNSILSFW